MITTLRLQIPWIMAGSVRDNVVFDSDWDEAWYRQVRAHVCAHGLVCVCVCCGAPVPAYSYPCVLCSMFAVLYTYY